jgi:hypothetical protein
MYSSATPSDVVLGIVVAVIDFVLMELQIPTRLQLLLLAAVTDLAGDMVNASTMV